MIIWDIVVLGHTAYDFGWHEFTLRPKNGRETIRKRYRYFELWKKNSAGDWKISLVINNADVRDERVGKSAIGFLTRNGLKMQRAREEREKQNEYAA